MSLAPISRPTPQLNPVLAVEKISQPEIKSWNINSVFEQLKDAKNKIVIIVFKQNRQNHLVAGLLDEAQFENNVLKIRFAEVNHEWLWFVGNHITGHEDTKVVKLPHALWKDIFFKAAKAKFYQNQVTLPEELILSSGDPILAFHILTSNCVADLNPKFKIPESLLIHLKPSGSA